MLQQASMNRIILMSSLPLITLSLIFLSFIPDARYIVTSDHTGWEIAGGFLGQAPHYVPKSVLNFATSLLLPDSDVIQRMILILLVLWSGYWLFTHRYSMRRLTAIVWTLIGVALTQTILEPGEYMMRLQLLTLWSFIIFSSNNRSMYTKPMIFALIGVLYVLELSYMAIPVLLTPLFLSDRDHSTCYPKHSAFLWVLCSILAITIPAKNFESIESSDRVVVERSEFLTGTDPIFGVSMSYQFTDRSTLRKAYAPAAAVIMILLLLLHVSRTVSKEEHPMFLFTLILSIIALLDTCLVPETVSIASPLYALDRILPTALHNPLLPQIMGLNFCLLLILSRKIATRFEKFHSFFFILSAFSLTLAILSAFSRTLPEVTTNRSIKDFKNILNRINLENRFGGKSHFLESASVQLLSELNIDRLHLSPRLGTRAFTSCRAIGCRLDENSTSDDSMLLKRIVEEKNNRPGKEERFSVRPDVATSFSIRLPDTVKTRTIVLQSAPFTTDFPTQFRYSFSQDCTVWEPEQSVTEWKGALLLAQHDKPVLRQESWVELHSATPFRCFHFTKPKYEGYFDWSLTNVLIRTED